ncbi:MAG: bifunctional glutamate N-acetyltransferase/amino-acid acetyltransferase ArgJ [Chloroflexi bacterium]|nr:MAG: bifunctional glutamate N-acetyltransferase/amino-acid acetyltransferase ArgJ [Chloroflexota bacterium]
MQINKNGSITSPKGFQAGAVAAQIKYKDRLDLTVVYSEVDCSGTAVFTKNQVVAAPVIVSRNALAKNSATIRGIIANAGIANACTGAPGLDNAQQMQQLSATALGCKPEQILVLSTGVIGMHIPMDRMATGITAAVEQMSGKNGRLAAQAIMTTDTYPKQQAIQVQLSGGTVMLGGMAKGSGMIHPNMATMLGVVTTDAEIAPEVLEGMLVTAVNQSFNRITIDGDTSTNDTVFLLANGANGIAVTGDKDQQQFQTALNTLCKSLAHMIVRDGEGATKFVEIHVCGTATNEDAHTIANVIATSPLVKTAFAGSDPNWGRIFAAAGRAGIPFDQYKASLLIGIESATELELVSQGTPTDYLEEDAAHIFAQAAFKIQLDLGSGPGSDTVWTSDLSHDYVTINADYRT